MKKKLAGAVFVLANCLITTNGFGLQLNYYDSNSPVVRANYTGTSGYGVYGYASASTGYSSGVFGKSNSESGYGVYGYNGNGGFGVIGKNLDPAGYGVYGYNSATSGTAYGVYGKTGSSSGYGVYCEGNFRVTGSLERNNLASSASVTASSYFSAGYSPEKAIDNIINRWDEGEWASKGETSGAWIQLSWTNAQSISEIWLYDRPNKFDQIYDAYLYIDNDGNGTTDHILHLGMFPYGAAPKIVPLTSAEGNTAIRSIKLVITESAPTTQNAGISEIVCYP